MTFRPPIDPARIDLLVREALEADARAIDAAALESAIAARLAARTVERVPLRRRRWVRWSVALAASLLLVALFGEQFLVPPRPASAYTVVNSAYHALVRGADRCYQVEQLTVPRIWRPFLQPGDETLIWTRGDRFHVVTRRGDQTLLWGQDEQQRFWGVLDPQRGLLYERREVPAALREALSCLNLDAGRITAEILSDFVLTREAADADTVLIRATLKARPKQKHHFTSVLLDIEPATMIIRRMEVTRTVNDKHIARLSFTLVDDRTMTDDHYRLSGNLQPGAEIYDRTRGVERQRLFVSQMRRN
ncbi:MAG: hypothetical protein AB7U73_03065 [Pirellulales bacterium]